MSREDYVAIGARLFAIYVGIHTILQIPSSVQMLKSPDGMSWAWLYALALVLSLAICAFLWNFPLTVARKLLPVMKEARSEQTVDSSIGLSLGITLIGVWLIGQGLLDSIYWLAMIIRTNSLVSSKNYGFEWQPDDIASMVLAGFELLIGGWLVLGSSGVKRLIYKFRYGSQ
jgi:hypothetical protein